MTAVATEWTLAGILRGHAAARPDSPMITHEGRTITWAEMDERANRVARGLQAAGVGAGDRVAILDKNGPEYFEVLFGGGKINAVNVAVNWRLAAPEMEFVINDSTAKVLFVGPDFFPHLDQIAERLSTVTTIVVLGEHPRHESYESWLARQDATDPHIPVAAEDVAVQLYTSGTTGLPKGAMITNRNLGTLIPGVSPLWSLDHTSICVVALPLFHIGGSGWALCSMWNGAHSLLFREFVPARILAAITEHRATNALFVPAMLQFMAAIPGAADGDYTSLRSIVYGASPITTETLLRAMATFRCDLIQVYGLTETTGAVTQLDAADHDPEGPRAGLLRSAGRPYPWVEVRVADPATGEAVPQGAVGEVWIRCAQNMKGYWNKPQANEAAFTTDGWFKSGDAGYLDNEGFVFLTDRIKDMIVSGGENVYPIEVENVLAQHPDVADVAVIGVPDDRWGETVKAVIVPRPGVTPDTEAIIAFARERLARFKCPTSIDLTTEISTLR